MRSDREDERKRCSRAFYRIRTDSYQLLSVDFRRVLEPSGIGFARIEETGIKIETMW